MSTDDRFDQESQEMQEMLRLVRSYNEPPPTPRDAIWNAIQQRRKVRALPPVWQRRPVWAVAAALALVVLGVGLGRMTVRRPQPETVALGDAPQRAGNTAQRIYTASHLGRSEAFLSQFAAAPGGSDPELAAWARSLLTDTRLLLDADAGLDPETVELLRDLEFVLVQIAHASASPEERQWVTEGMEQRAVMDRLRVLMTPRRQVPAGI